MLTVCASCKRHVRSGECPFCGSTARIGTRAHRIGRVFFALGTGAAISSYACSAYGAPSIPSGPYVPHDAGPEADGDSD